MLLLNILWPLLCLQRLAAISFSAVYSVSWKVLESEFLSPGKPWNLVFASPVKQCFNVCTNPELLFVCPVGFLFSSSNKIIPRPCQWLGYCNNDMLTLNEMFDDVRAWVDTSGGIVDSVILTLCLERRLPWVHCITVEWSWWDWSLISKTNWLFQCFDTVG